MFQDAGLTGDAPLSEADNLLAEPDIDVCNVRPAFEASIAAGVSEADIQARLGWTRERLYRDGETVSGTSTHDHMEWMSTRLDFADFILDAVVRHTPASLGVVGFACKTAASLGEAMARHARYQELTNRTARYDARLDGDQLRVEETRFGPATPGSQRLSDYTILVAVHLLRELLGPPFRALTLHSRRAELSARERTVWEDFAGAPIETGHPQAALIFPAELVGAALPTHDAELSAYFSRVLARAAPNASDLGWVDKVRAAIEQRLPHGTPTVDFVAGDLGVGARTLARRLGEESQTFGAVLASVRRARARVLLADPALSQAEVAYLLGYRDQASFHRAFRRWFGTTPAAFRRR